MKRSLVRDSRRCELLTDPEAAGNLSSHHEISPVGSAIPSVALPEGWTEGELRTVWGSFSIDGSPAGSLDPYVAEAYGRITATWKLVEHESGKALELGSNPFLMTWMLEQFTDLDVSQANFFDDRGPRTQELEWVDRSGNKQSQSMDMLQFNMEEDRFPYADASFDVVLFCEIIEHLLSDPLNALKEIRRVLKPSGRLVLTTPNVGRLENVIKLLQGAGIYDPYSGFGPYGRHNREYTPHEAYRLLAFAGFDLDQVFTADSVAWDRQSCAELAASVEEMMGAQRLLDLGQYIFIVARPGEDPKTGYPDMFFRSMPEGTIVPWS